MENPFAVLSLVASILEQQGITYVLVGSLASSMHGMYRSTADIDLLADVKAEQVLPLLGTLQYGFYVDEPAVREAIARKGSFNAIHFDSVFKVDIFIPKGDAFSRKQLERRELRKLSWDGDQMVYVATVEDTILAKLRWYDCGGRNSNTQWHDVMGMIGASATRLDEKYLREWAETLGVSDLLGEAFKAAPGELREFGRMKINIIGGGPAGMYFAILMKKSDPSHEITIYERNGPDDTFGWGVVFSGKTLANLRAADEESHAEITRSFEAWDNVDVVHRDEKISIHGNSFSGIARLDLLKILQRRCEELGIATGFPSRGFRYRFLARRAAICWLPPTELTAQLESTIPLSSLPTLDVRPNRYIWYGTNKLFHGLTLTFRQDDAGVFAAHSYKFSKTTSTFIVECDQETWNTAGFANLDDAQTRVYIEKVFAQDLDGQPLLSNNSKWINFLLVKNRQLEF